MAQILFDNPNSPEQPAKGVYRWFYRSDDSEITIYVGCAGNRAETVGSPSTLKRGVQEAQRSCVTSDKGKLLDTDFVVGTTLMYLKREGFDCIWQHISDNPKDEADLCVRHRPLLQTKTGSIDRAYRFAKPGNSLWSRHDIALAEELLLSILRERFPVGNGSNHDSIRVLTCVAADNDFVGCSLRSPLLGVPAAELEH